MEKLDIIRILRRDARTSQSNISTMIGVPLSTARKRLIGVEKEFVKKHTSIVDFDKLGFSIQMHVLTRSDEKGMQYLKQHKNVNSLSRIKGRFNYHAEVVFRNMREAEKFKSKITKPLFKSARCFYIMKTLQKEDFLSNFITKAQKNL